MCSSCHRLSPNGQTKEGKTLLPSFSAVLSVIECFVELVKEEHSYQTACSITYKEIQRINSTGLIPIQYMSCTVVQVVSS